MPCYRLQIAFPLPGKTKNGKTAYLFAGSLAAYLLNGTFKKKRKPLAKGFILTPCRQCIGCRLEKSRQWATRLMHETKYHNNACFLTLTYANEFLPENATLNKDHIRVFINDLRSRMNYYGKEKLKYFAVGEYADPNEKNPTGRPHYHLALFGPIPGHPGLDFRTSELIPDEPSRSGHPQWLHPDISAVWPYGRHTVAELSFESAAYVARYCLKKISGISAPAHYGPRIPEFQRNSNGLGKSHTETWISDVYPGDQVVLPGRGAFQPPPYYDRILEKIDPKLFTQVKQARKEAQEPLTSREDLLEVFNERLREGTVRQLVTDATLIRSI